MDKLSPLSLLYGEDGRQYDGKMLRVGGLITAKKQVMTKRNEQMAIITLEDFTHAVSVVVFPKTYGRYQQFVAVDMAVSIRGRADINDDSIQILAEEVRPLGQETGLRTGSRHRSYRLPRLERPEATGIPAWGTNSSSKSRLTSNGLTLPAVSVMS